MCGIAGVASRGGAFTAADADVAAHRLHHRGPDAGGSRSFGECALGHTRLRIIDLSPLGDQPLPNEDRTVWAVFNGEIYNFGELRRDLESAGHRFLSDTDSEVLVHLYEEDGDELASRLRGMFAFAIWDTRRRRLLLCRDRLGVKPLYYRVEGGDLAFASEVQALARTSDEVDVAALHGFLRLGWVPGPATILAGVEELLPGHQLSWEDGSATVRRYWSLPVPDPGSAPPTPAELADVLRDAMRRHLVADVPVGLFLSAGVDSVVLARLAADIAPDLRSYTVAFDTPEDESPEAQAIARRLGIENTVVRVDDIEALASLGSFVAGMDQPTVDGLNSWLISRAVRDAGAVVALSGIGGDELFAGYSTFWHVPRLVRAGRVLGRLPGLPDAAADALARSGRTASWRGRRALEAVARGGSIDAYAAVRGLFGVAELERLWPPAREHAGNRVVRTTGRPGGDGLAAVADLELANYLPFQLLRDGDCMSMAHALEVRVPLLDDAVVEVAARGLRSDPAWSKRRLVSAVDPELLPLVDRPKRTFTLPIDDWMRGRLNGVVEDALVSLGDAGLGFDRRALTDLWLGYGAGHVGWRPVWALTVLGRWLGERDARPAATVPASVG